MALAAAMFAEGSTEEESKELSSIHLSLFVGSIRIYGWMQTALSNSAVLMIVHWKIE